MEGDPESSQTSHPLSDEQDAEEKQREPNPQEKGDTQTEPIDLSDGSEEGGSGGDQTPRHEQEPKQREDGTGGGESMFSVQSCVKVKNWIMTSWLFRKKESGEEKKKEQKGDETFNTVNQTPSSSNTEPPGDVRQQDGQKSKHLKCIFYDMDGDASWLIDQLNDGSISGYDCITCHTLEELKAEECSLVILCLSHESRCEGNVKEFLEWCRKPVIRIITGLENSSSEKEKREYWENVSQDLSSPKFDPIILTKREVETIRTNNSETRERLDTKIKGMKDILQNSAAKIPGIGAIRKMLKQKVDIGIFSRSDESDYSWLVELLRSANFSDRGQNVTSCYISNSGRQKFREDVSKCKYAILYHTKNRGRINVTDVTDALYDEELGYLSGQLGKDNVIVVIDDLEDSSEAEKNRILKSQESIETLARGLFLFSPDEKVIAGAGRKMTQLRAMITDSKDLSSKASGDHPDLYPPSPPGTP